MRVYALDRCEDGELDHIASRILAGDIFIFPSDTVYGIGCSARSQLAVDRVFDVKRRDPGKPLPVFVASVEAALVSIHPLERDALERIGRAFWPGAVTVVADVLNSGLCVQPSSQGMATSIGFRVPAHSGLLRLLERGLTVSQTSLNESGAETIRDVAAPAADVLRSRVDFELTSRLRPVGTASTVVRITPDGVRVLREGSIAGADIAKAIDGCLL